MYKDVPRRWDQSGAARLNLVDEARNLTSIILTYVCFIYTYVPYMELFFAFMIQRYKVDCVSLAIRWTPPQFLNGDIFYH